MSTTESAKTQPLLQSQTKCRAGKSEFNAQSESRRLPRLEALTSAIVLSVAIGGAAQASVWKIDTAHSSADFSVRHMMISNVKGRFPKVEGSVDYDGKDLKGLKVEADIDVSSVDTGEKGRDEHLKSPDFFDIAKFPKMTFKSKKVKKLGKDKFSMVGDLTIKGVTKEVTLQVEGPSAEVKDMKGNQRVGASATTTINRKDFGITWNKAMDNGGAVVGDDIKVSLEVEAVKQ